MGNRSCEAYDEERRKTYDKSIKLFIDHICSFRSTCDRRLEEKISLCGITHFAQHDVANTIEHESRSQIKIMLLIIISEFNECER